MLAEGAKKKRITFIHTPCRVPHPRRAQRGRVVVSRVKTRESFWQVAHISQFPAYLEYVCSVFLVVIPAGDLLLSLLLGSPSLQARVSYARKEERGFSP